MGNFLYFDYAKVQLLGFDGIPRGEPIYGYLACDSDTDAWSMRFDSFEDLKNEVTFESLPQLLQDHVGFQETGGFEKDRFRCLVINGEERDPDVLLWPDDFLLGYFQGFSSTEQIR